MAASTVEYKRRMEGSMIRGNSSNCCIVVLEQGIEARNGFDLSAEVGRTGAKDLIELRSIDLKA